MPAMSASKWMKWVAAIVLLPILFAILFIAIAGWNWLRAPIEREVLDRTGRVFKINGDLRLKWHWPRPHVEAAAVTFANPDWALQKQMLSADLVDVTVDLSRLLKRTITFPDVRLVRPVVFLEQGSGGRKNWLLDLDQQDEAARIGIERLTLDQGILGYDDSAQKTSIRASLTSTTGSAEGAAGTGVAFSASGRYKDLPLTASGSGGPVLALRDDTIPYRLVIAAAIGRTHLKGDGTVTSLSRIAALDMRLLLAGDSLDQLYPLFGLALPATRAYTTSGHLLHHGSIWRYATFAGKVGSSDIAGTLQVDVAGKRPALQADLVSAILDLEDLGPVIGARPGSVKQAKAQAAAVAGAAPAAAAAAAAAAPAASVAATAATARKPASGRVLPDLPFNTERWDSVDAEVTLKAKSIRRASELPLENFNTHLSLRDSQLTLDPFSVGVAGGRLEGTISLDAQQQSIKARVLLRARRMQIAKLFPTVAQTQSGIGQVNGEFDLSGRGNSVGAMLAGSSGKVGLVVAGGEISKLMMEKAGLHLWEILLLGLSGDKLVKLRCAVADFEVQRGNMRARALVFDTEVTTIAGSGNIDLGHETLDLILRPKTKRTSPLSLQSPILVGGTFARPEVGVDKGQVALRAIGAVALGALNPFLALIPLIDAGPGADSDCAQLVRDARAVPRAPGKAQSAARPG